MRRHAVLSIEPEPLVRSIASGHALGHYRRFKRGPFTMVFCNDDGTFFVTPEGLLPPMKGDYQSAQVLPTTLKSGRSERVVFDAAVIRDELFRSTPTQSALPPTIEARLRGASAPPKLGPNEIIGVDLSGRPSVVVDASEAAGLVRWVAQRGLGLSGVVTRTPLTICRYPESAGLHE